jgi:hypothetical protein
MADYGKICGRSYRLEPTMPGVHRRRVIVDGMHHPKGLPIRFKSLKRAENHIRNLRMDIPEEPVEERLATVEQAHAA